MGVSFCSECKDKTCLKTKKPCNQVEALLRSEGIYSSNFIRPQMPVLNGKRAGARERETPFSSLSKKDKLNLGLDAFLYDDEARNT